MKKDIRRIGLVCLVTVTILATGFWNLDPASAKEIEKPSESLVVLSQEQLRPFQTIRKVQIIVEKNEFLDRVDLPFIEVTRKFLKYAGIEAVVEESKGDIPILKIEVAGSTKYQSGYWGPGLQKATLKGCISIDVQDTPFTVRELFSSFAAKSEDLLDVWSGEPWDFLDYSKVFNLAFWGRHFDFNFLPELAYMIGKIFGYDKLVAATKDKDSRIGEIAVLAIGKDYNQENIDILISILKDYKLPTDSKKSKFETIMEDKHFRRWLKENCPDVTFAPDIPIQTTKGKVLSYRIAEDMINNPVIHKTWLVLQKKTGQTFVPDYQKWFEWSQSRKKEATLNN